MKAKMHKIDRDFAKWVSPRNKPERKRRLRSSEIVIHPGVRVLVIGAHPWTGHTGTVEGKIKTLVGELWVVNLDCGSNAGATDAELKAV